MTNTRIVRRRVQQNQPPPPKKKRKILKRIFLVLLLAFLSVLGYGTYLYVKAGNTLSDSYVNDGREKSELRDEFVDPTKDNISMLIMGVDTSEKRKDAGEPRTDALMVATFNKNDKSVKLLSIPRDAYVYIPEVDRETKINHAHAYGGPNATIDTVENLLDIPIDYWVTLNFEAFIDVVDAIGGITVDVPYDFEEQDSKDRAGAISLKEGIQDLDGEEALALARTRKKDSDVMRGQRQQDIIKAIAKKSVSLGSVFKYDDIIDAVGKNMSTNMKFAEIRALVHYATTNLDIETYTLEGEDYWPPGSAYYWMIDEEALGETKSMLQKHLNITRPTVIQ